MTPEDWRDLAACRGRPTSIWYSTDRATEAVAVAYCRRCPVRAACLDAALLEEARVWELTFGVRGGLAARDRDALRSRPRSPTSPPRRLPELGGHLGAIPAGDQTIASHVRR